MELMCKPDEEPSVYLKELLDELAERIEMWDDAGVYKTEVEEIEHEWRDGFIPFTNGGWDGCAFCSFMRGKDHFNILKKYADNDYKDMIKSFKEAMIGKYKAAEHSQMPPEDSDLYARLVEMSDEDFWDHFNKEMPYDEENKELFTKSQMHWQYVEPAAWRWQEGWEQDDDTVFFLKFRVQFYSADNHRSETGEDEVFFYAAVNTDFNYGRDYVSWFPAYGMDANCNRAEFRETVKVSELTREKAEEIINKMEETLRNA